MLSEALKELIRERNKESLDGLNQLMNPCGEWILFCAGNQLNELMLNHLGEKRLAFCWRQQDILPTTYRI